VSLGVLPNATNKSLRVTLSTARRAHAQHRSGIAGRRFHALEDPHNSKATRVLLPPHSGTRLAQETPPPPPPDFHCGSDLPR